MYINISKRIDVLILHLVLLCLPTTEELLCVFLTLAQSSDPIIFTHCLISFPLIFSHCLISFPLIFGLIILCTSFIFYFYLNIPLELSISCFAWWLISILHCLDYVKICNSCKVNKGFNQFQCIDNRKCLYKSSPLSFYTLIFYSVFIWLQKCTSVVTSELCNLLLVLFNSLFVILSLHYFLRF